MRAEEAAFIAYFLGRTGFYFYPFRIDAEIDGSRLACFGTIGGTRDPFAGLTITLPTDQITLRSDRITSFQAHADMRGVGRCLPRNQTCFLQVHDSRPSHEEERASH